MRCSDFNPVWLHELITHFNIFEKGYGHVFIPKKPFCWRCLRPSQMTVLRGGHTKFIQAWIYLVNPNTVRTPPPPFIKGGGVRLSKLMEISIKIDGNGGYYTEVFLETPLDAAF